MLFALAVLATQSQAQAPQRPADFVDAATVVPGLIVEMRYAGSHNFTGQPVDGYQAPHCLLTRQAAAALAEVARDVAPRGLVIKVFDCYRPVRAVMNFVRWARDLNDQTMKAEFYPNVDKRTLFRDGYIASHSGHSRGSTMDLTLAKTDGTELDMGTHFDFFSPKSWAADADGQPAAARQPHAARRGDGPARLSRLRQGMVALHAARRAVPDDLFRFSGAVDLPLLKGRGITAPNKIS